MVEPTPFILTQYGSLENLEKYCRDMPKIVNYQNYHLCF